MAKIIIIMIIIMALNQFCFHSISGQQTTGSAECVVKFDKKHETRFEEEEEQRRELYRGIFEDLRLFVLLFSL